MAYLRKKTTKGIDYYSIVQSRRVNGKVKQEILEYIGTLDRLYEKLTADQNKDVSLKSYEHGASYGLLKIAGYLNIPELLDRNLPARKRDGISRGMAFTLAAIQRAVCPGSKASFETWFRTTTLPYYLNCRPEIFSSQFFWEQMDDISEDDLKKAEDAITSKILGLFPESLQKLSLDYTNYHTFISSFNKRCDIAQSGHNKQKRNDLRQVSLAIVTLKDFGIPLFSHVYKGNVNDQGEFRKYIQLLKERLPDDAREDLTIVFDGGSNTKDNINGLEFHFICSFSLHSCKDLYEISIDDYQAIELEEKTVRFYRTSQNIWSRTRECILTYSNALYAGQAADLEKNIQKAKNELDKLNERLKNPKARITHEEEKLKEICKSRLSAKYMQDIFDVKVASDEIKYEISDIVKNEICRKYFGKKLLITDHADWETKDILEAYYEQDQIENVFRDSKNVEYCSMRPLYHWTDQKIRVHVFICLLSLILTGVLQKIYSQNGQDLSRQKMLEELIQIREDWVKGPGGKTVYRQLEEMTVEQTEYWKILNAVVK